MGEYFKGNTMADELITEVIPVYTDEHDRMRVSGTRVLLDLVVYAYHQGETPEHIIQMYPTLTLDNVYLAIGYYLRHRDAIDAYLRRMEAEAEALRREIEANQPPAITREELMARMKAKRDEISG
jgi:uncharacterized protein (DUF433 family)